MSSSPEAHILFIDDDADVLKAARLLLERNGMRMSAAQSPAEAWSVIGVDPADIILLDLNFTRGSTNGEEGFRHLAELISLDPDVIVVVVTGHSGVNIAVAAMRAGAVDFIMKPWSNERFVATLRSALDLRHRRLANSAPRPGDLTTSRDGSGLNHPLLGDSEAMAHLKDLMRRAAPTDAPVLIYGAAGSGRSSVARSIHIQSRRATAPFIEVDVGSISPEDAETALFGRRDGDGGAFAAAAHGSLLLNEVAGMSPALQNRLISVLETGRSTVRLLSSTRRSPEELRGPGGLRHDLLFKLNTVVLRVPSLAERGGDRLQLAEHYLRLSAKRFGVPLLSLGADAADFILQNAWPGEVRELKQAMERCVIFAQGPAYGASDILKALATEQGGGLPTEVNLAQSERSMISAALKRSSFNVSHAAKELGLSRAALYRRMTKHGL